MRASDENDWRGLTASELQERLILDPVFFLETLCEVADYGPEGGSVPFILNAAQRRYVREIWLPGCAHDVVGKSRKWGFSTLRIGLGLHGCLYTPDWTFRIVAHRQVTADNLNRTVRKLYTSAWKQLERLGLNPAQFIPRATGDRKTGMEFGQIGSIIHVETASGQGVGQSDRSDDIYATEYSDWQWPDVAFQGLAGSQPKAASGLRCTIDFNAHGTGNDAYLK